LTVAVKMSFSGDFGEALEADLERGRRQLSQIMSKEALRIGAEAARNGKSSFRRTSNGGLIDDMIAPAVFSQAGARFEVSIGSDKPYARIRDEGGTIEAKNGRVLSIPVAEELKNQLSGMRGPRDFKGHWRKLKDETKIGFFEDETDRLLFIGVPKVTQTGTRFFSRAWDKVSPVALRNIGDGFWQVVFEEGE
jgi:hypothetical protein